MDKNDSSGCSGLLALAGLGFMIFLLYKAVQFLLTPEGIKSIVEFMAGLGVCVGLIVLALLGLTVYYRFFYHDPYHKIVSMSRDYRARCYVADLAKITPDSTQASSPENPERAVDNPIYLLLSLTNYGPCLELLSLYGTEQYTPAENASRFLRLSGNHPDPIILPVGYFHLYHSLYPQVGDRSHEPTTSNEANCTGPLAALPEGQLIQIVIVYTGILVKEDLSHIITREQPLKLTLVALDENGHDNPAATRELYKVVYEFLNPPDSDSDEDDSWMYRSRPIWY
jgi:hypothetical protein